MVTVLTNSMSALQALTKHVSEETTNKKYTYNLIDVSQGNVYYEKPKNTDNIQIYR